MKLLALAPLSFIFGILKFFLNQLITTKFLERTINQHPFIGSIKLGIAFYLNSLTR